MNIPGFYYLQRSVSRVSFPVVGFTLKIKIDLHKISTSVTRKSQKKQIMVGFELFLSHFEQNTNSKRELRDTDLNYSKMNKDFYWIEEKNLTRQQFCKDIRVDLLAKAHP